MIVLFQNSKKWKAEILAAQTAGFEVAFFDWDALHEGKLNQSLRLVPTLETETQALLRCHTLRPHMYEYLYYGLLKRGVRLMNDVGGYTGGLLTQTRHHLQELLPDTFVTLGQPFANITRTAQDISHHFKNGKLMLKGEWGSAKYQRTAPWDISNAGDISEVTAAIKQLQHWQPLGSIIATKFEELRKVSPHRLPFTGQHMYEEYRLFFFKNKLVTIGNYFEELPDYYQDRISAAEITALTLVASKVSSSHFFVLDVARKQDGSLMVIETNPAEVSGFAIRYASALYQGIQNILNNNE